MADFPLYRNYYKPSKHRFNILVKSFHPKIVSKIPMKMKYKKQIDKFRGRYVLIEENWDGNEELNNLTDCFSEHVRIRCKFKNYPTPYEYWNKHKKEIIEAAQHTHDIKRIRDVIYQRTRLCNNFRITVAYTFFKLFSAKKILDPTAGWGDRLIAAIAHKTDLYVGVDTNPDLHPCYARIKQTLCETNRRKNFILIHDAIEHAKLPISDFDLVFACPPFFDMEEYSQSPVDSYNAHPTETSWLNDFLLVMLKKSYDHLRQGGHLVLYLAESTETNYVGKMMKYMNKLMTYMGSIYYYYTTTYKPRRFFVWRKV